VRANAHLYAEYAVSGWFKWTQFEAEMNTWHAGFRLASNTGEDNTNKDKMGDRTLGLFVGGPATDNILGFVTYTYTDLNGNGNPNNWQAVPYTGE
jgi:hypothetical protein